ncbi:NAD(P)-binding protein [Apiospora hydei]|uniref:NAD(P)-binding protein n=1 Tax=Apiospora hydei TaxID=1337664 RepID=A0ABR1WBF6_9PEZI
MGDYDWFLDHTPARKPPPGVESNFVNPESHSYQLIIVIAVMFTLVVLFTGGRIYTRLRITKSFGADDYLCIAAAVFVLAGDLTALMMCDKPGGGPGGTHLWDTTLRKWIYYSKACHFRQSRMFLAIAYAGCAFFVFYLRLFGPKDHVRAMVWAGMTVVVCFCIAFEIGYLVTALPHDGDFLAPDYQARLFGVPQKLITAGAYISVLTDFYIMFIPLHQIPKLGLSYKRKWGISFIFLTGLLATGAGVANLVFRHNPTIMDLKDSTWNGQYVLMTSLCENNLGIVCLSMPVVLALFVGRISALGQSLGSWVNIRRAQRHGAGDSASNLSPSDGNDSGPDLPKQHMPDPKMGGMRKYIRNLNHSRADNTTTVMTTFNDLTSADLSYHHQLKALHPSQTASSRSNKYEKLEKLG